MEREINTKDIVCTISAPHGGYDCEYALITEAQSAARLTAGGLPSADNCRRG